MYLRKEQTAKFHSEAIWNDGAVSIFEEGRPNKKKNNKNNKMSSNMRSDQFLKKYTTSTYTIMVLLATVETRVLPLVKLFLWYQIILWLNIDFKQFMIAVSGYAVVITMDNIPLNVKFVSLTKMNWVIFAIY